jgi:hypothetical protein
MEPMKRVAVKQIAIKIWCWSIHPEDDPSPKQRFQVDRTVNLESLLALLNPGMNLCVAA